MILNQTRRSVWSGVTVSFLHGVAKFTSLSPLCGGGGGGINGNCCDPHAPLGLTTWLSSWSWIQRSCRKLSVTGGLCPERVKITFLPVGGGLGWGTEIIGVGVFQTPEFSTPWVQWPGGKSTGGAGNSWSPMIWLTSFKADLLRSLCLLPACWDSALTDSARWLKMLTWRFEVWVQVLFGAKDSEPWEQKTAVVDQQNLHLHLYPKSAMTDHVQEKVQTAWILLKLENPRLPWGSYVQMAQGS